jgi:hypothetical protein
MQRKALIGLIDQYHAGAITQQQFEASAQSAAAQMVPMIGRISELKGTGGANGQGIIGLSYGLQDIITVLSYGGGWQRALMSATNNITPMLAGLGMGPGMAGALGLLVTVLTAAIPLVQSLGDKLGLSSEGVRLATEALTKANEELRKKYEELSAASDKEVKALKAENEALAVGVKLKERQGELDEQALKNRTRPIEEETKRQVAAKAMEGAPSVDQQRRAGGQKARADEIKKIVGGDPEAQAIRQAVIDALEWHLSTQENPTGGWEQGARREEANKRANKLLGDFYAGDPESLKKVMGMLHPLMETQGRVRRDLEQLTPEAQNAQRGRNLAGIGGNFMRRVAEANAAEAKRRRDAQTDMLNAQGREGEQAGKDRRAADYEVDQAKKKAAADAKQADQAKKDDAFFGARRAQQLAGQVRQRTGLPLSPAAAAGLAGPDLKLDDAEMAVARAAQQLRREVFEASGLRMSGEQALQQVRAAQQQLLQAQGDFVQANLAAAAGQARQIQMLRQATQQMRQRQQTAATVGIP